MKPVFISLEKIKGTKQQTTTQEVQMKSINMLFAIIVFLCFVTTLGFASDFKAEQPFLITAAGQGPDVTMVKVLAQKHNLKFTFDKLAKPENLKDHPTLIIVTGASTKGLGAANIDKEQELARVQAIVKAAKEAKMKIITMHVGGISRRGNYQTISTPLQQKMQIVSLSLKMEMKIISSPK